MPNSISIHKIAQLTGHNSAIYALGLGKDSYNLLSAAGDGWIVNWDLRDPEMGKLLAKVETQAFSFQLLEDKNTLVVGNMNGGVHWVNLEKPDLTKNVLHHKKGTFAIEIARDYIFTGGGEGIISRWLSTGKLVDSYHLSNKSIRSIAFCSQRNEIAVGASDNHIYLLDVVTLNLKQTLPNAHENSVFSLKYAPNGKYLLSGGRDAHLNIWEVEQGYQQISTQPAHWFTINDIVFSPCGKYFATASRDKTLKIWDADNFQLLKVLETIRDKGHLNSVNALHWSPYNNYLLSAGDDRSIIIWKVEDGIVD